ncbi:hypothetical protein BDZ45DRAFT_799371 [Acephala macrosclerotiorum]|nr:hypothetical protein BDZ45DRAFT_799371 [Acephala macrosclerotiorum]
MGTSGLLGIIIAAQRHGMHNHFDSYPDGLGKDIMNQVPRRWLFCAWAYFVDFEKRTFETWGYGKFWEEISFEGLSKSEADAYLEKMRKKGQWGDEVSDSEDEEDEPRTSGGHDGKEKSDGGENDDELVPEGDHEEAEEVVNDGVAALAIGEN